MGQQFWRPCFNCAGHLDPHITLWKLGVCGSCLGYLHKMNDASWNKQDKSSPASPFLSTEERGSPAYLDQRSIFHMCKVMWDKPHHFSTFFLSICQQTGNNISSHTAAVRGHHPLLFHTQSYAIVLRTALYEYKQIFKRQSFVWFFYYYLFVV